MEEEEAEVAQFRAWDSGRRARKKEREATRLARRKVRKEALQEEALRWQAEQLHQRASDGKVVKGEEKGGSGGGESGEGDEQQQRLLLAAFNKQQAAGVPDHIDFTSLRRAVREVCRSLSLSLSLCLFCSQLLYCLPVSTAVGPQLLFACLNYCLPYSLN